LVVSHQGVLSLLIARLIGMPAEAMWHFRVDQGCWSAIDINQKFATLRVLNSRAIGVENA
ncbi:histidine phosphatase family protein, partial [Klebsiella pneumoniae]